VIAELPSEVTLPPQVAEFNVMLLTLEVATVGTLVSGSKVAI
jgi:hypothetical protein